MLDAEDIDLADSPASLCPGTWVTAEDKFGGARCGFEIGLSGTVCNRDPNRQSECMVLRVTRRYNGRLRRCTVGVNAGRRIR
jgi:hypothetical protein